VNLIKKEGIPVLDYQIKKQKNDTVLFYGNLFSLNKKYKYLSIVTNNHNTIHPNYLYKSNLISNVKYFSFKLPVARNIDKLILYTDVYVFDSCIKEKQFFEDTTVFKGTKLK
jgi:hypothetical protein